MNAVLEAWKGARDAARAKGRQFADVQDGAQDAALAILEALSKGRTVRAPRAYGRRVEGSAVRWRFEARAQQFVDGFGWGEVQS